MCGGCSNRASTHCTSMVVGTIDEHAKIFVSVGSKSICSKDVGSQYPCVEVCTAVGKSVGLRGHCRT